MSEELGISRELLADIKAHVRQAQQRAALSANAEMTRHTRPVPLYSLQPRGH